VDMFLIFDTETTGLPKNYNAPISDSDNWPRLVQLAWQLHDEKGQLIEVKNFIVKPVDFTIPFNSEKIHGISTQRAQQEGTDLDFVLQEFACAIEKSKFLVGHNVEFDINIVGAEYFRNTGDESLATASTIDTKEHGTEFCAIPGGKGGKFKWPTLAELHQKLFGEDFSEAHNASADVEATARCFLEMIRLSIIPVSALGKDKGFFTVFKEHNPTPISLIGLNIKPYAPLEENKESTAKENDTTKTAEATNIPPVISDTSTLNNFHFAHLHSHTQFSILQATSDIKQMVAKAVEDKMEAVAITDHGNMFGVFQFVQEANNKGIKPIIGCEFNVCADHTNKTTKDNGNQVVLLAKNKVGYENLCKLSSHSYADGFYYLPRVDKKLIEHYADGLIALSGGLRGEIPDLILNAGDKQAKEAFDWWKATFKDDFYLELNRHGLEEEEVVNKQLLSLAKQYQVKVVASNNVYYLDKSDANTHDILLCVKDGELKNTPIGKGRGFRYGFPNQEFGFKSQKEMKTLFADIPQAIECISEIVDKVKPFELKRDVLLPAFSIPEEFETEDEYLRHLTYEGAKKRFPDLTTAITDRIDFELQTIKNTGYPGYFLIVQDFTTQARKMGVAVGPGRGSAAGSVVAYCIGITNVDPIKYDLLFERFLNPDRISLPDIDIDFDDEGRSRVIDWVTNKYGKNQVAQIITYGTMAAKSSLRDTARVLDLPLSEADKIAKLMPDISLRKLFNLSDKELGQKLNREQVEKGKQLKKLAEGTDLIAQVIKQATKLEGSVRNTGTHACGVIITPSDITQFVPVATSKDAELLVTQFDNSVVESAGMLKMDFLGLKTLTIIKDAIELIQLRHNITIDPDEIPLDDAKTYELYQRGETNGTFQFESAGMQKHLRNLKPDKFEDLIAMNALYRPGPLEYIPNFIARKHGQEEITYDIPDMEEFLGETYGITVYQEQVMLLSQKLAGFSKGDADVLRKAMGKKIFALLEKLKPKFLEGCAERGHDVTKAEKVWKDWEAFAAYAFNKSHSTCYSVVAFQTAYLKANYPSEYMAAVLTNNMSDIKKVTFFMEECRKQGIPVLGPDINESALKFTVNDQNAIRFGLGAIKGVGESAIEAIVRERNENGHYSSIFNLTQRIDLRSANKKTLESMALAGGFDSFSDIHRAQYFFEDENGKTLIENAIRFGNKYQESQNSAQVSIFGDSEEAEVPEPPIQACPKWGTLQELSKEKEVVGIYISGHPLNDYQLEIDYFCNTKLSNFQDLQQLKGKEVRFAGIVTDAAHRVAKNGKPFGTISLEDYTDSSTFFLFSDEYVKFKDYLVNNWFLYIQGRVQEKPWDASQLEFKITRIELLSEVREKMAKSITIRVKPENVDERFVQQLVDLANKNTGSCELKLKFFDDSEELQVTSSSNKRINLSKEFINELQSLKEIQYKIN
jgi:DNA polymerase-3 subunit alpha